MDFDVYKIYTIYFPHNNMNAVLEEINKNQ